MLRTALYHIVADFLCTYSSNTHKRYNNNILLYIIIVLYLFVLCYCIDNIKRNKKTEKKKNDSTIHMRVSVVTHVHVHCE